MTQSVNLLNHLPKAKTDHISGKRILQFLGIWVITLSIIYGFEFMETIDQDAQIIQLTRLQQNAANKLASLAKKYPQLKQGNSSSKSLIAQAEEVKAKTQLLSVLSKSKVSSSIGFVDYMEALARVNIEGVWLKEIDIDNVEKIISISGSALDPTLIPLFTNKVNNDPEFLEWKLSVRKIERDESGKYINFILSNTGNIAPTSSDEEDEI